MKKGIIVGAGDFTERGLRELVGSASGSFSSGDVSGSKGDGSGPGDEQTPAEREVLVIAADGGLRHLQDAGMVPDIVIGDFDSLGYVPARENCSGSGQDNRPASVEMKKEIIRLPVEKDDTDMAAACRIAWDRGCRELVIYGGSGSRPDHFLANLQLMVHYSRLGGQVRLMAPAFAAYAVTNGRCVLRGEPGTTFSVFSHSNTAEGVSITGGAQYRLQETVLYSDRALGVSNCFTGRVAIVSVRRGTLLILQYHTPEDAA